jgi:tetrahydromethanopterin S-methyltransferase subunit A
MSIDYYPWGGEFASISPENNIAVVILNLKYIPNKKKIAIYGSLKTENIGIEKIVANVISNPNIRFLIICGEEIKGHKSGKSLLALHKYGINNNNKIKNAPGAIPYIENLKKEAINRFRNQIEIIDLIDINDKKKIDSIIDKYNSKIKKPYGKPYIAIKFKTEKKIKINDKRALHSKIRINYLGKVEKRGE